jgi:hypothetical protein
LWAIYPPLFLLLRSFGFFIVANYATSSLPQQLVILVLNRPLKKSHFLFVWKPYIFFLLQIEEAEAKKLGLKDEEFEIGKFISANSQEKWRQSKFGRFLDTF